MRILLTGGTGFIGSSLIPALRTRGDELIVLSRQTRISQPGCHFVRSLGEIDAREEIDAIINLAGVSLAARRWSAAYKREIVVSRLETTGRVLDLIRQLSRPPQILLSASAIGYYGHHGDEYLTESSEITPGFAQQLCADWESLALQAEQQDVRVCLLRLGVVLDRDGGALREMTQSFRFGVASWLGNGHQWLSWIHRQDVVRAILFLLGRSDLQGPFNITSPAPVTGHDFAVALAAHYRTFIRAGVPGRVMRLLVGEMAEELLLNGQRVVPERLRAADFVFSFPEIQSAMAEIYGENMR